MHIIQVISDWSIHLIVLIRRSDGRAFMMIHTLNDNRQIYLFQTFGLLFFFAVIRRHLRKFREFATAMTTTATTGATENLLQSKSD